MGIFKNRGQDERPFNDNQYATQRDSVKYMTTEQLENLKAKSPEGQRAVREELEARDK